MSREAYQVPTAQSSNPSASQANRSGGGAMALDDNTTGLTMTYMCGDCGTKFPLRRGDNIRCIECGCRVLYKERTKRMVQFEAR